MKLTDQREPPAAESNRQERAMTPERWKQMDELAQSALEQSPF
jgi:hypothetical protein